MYFNKGFYNMEQFENVRLLSFLYSIYQSFLIESILIFCFKFCMSTMILPITTKLFRVLNLIYDSPRHHPFSDPSATLTIPSERISVRPSLISGMTVAPFTVPDASALKSL